MLWPCLALTWLYGSPWSWRQNQGPWTPLPLTAFPFALSTSAQNHLSSARDLPCVSVPEHPSQSISGGRSRPGAPPALSRTGRRSAPMVHGGQCHQVAASDLGVVRRQRRALRGGQGARVDSRCHRAFYPHAFFLFFFLWQNINNINFINFNQTSVQLSVTKHIHHVVKLSPASISRPFPILSKKLCTY